MKIHVKVKPNSSEQKIIDFGVPPKKFQITFGRTSSEKTIDIKD